MVEAALSAAERGWRVVPVRPGEKRPYEKDWPERSSTDPTTIQAWWQRYPSASVGIATGAISGIIVLDIDPKGGGDDILAALEAQYGKLPETVEVVTGGSGRHIYFRHPGRWVKTVRGSLVGRPGVDVRGDGGMVVIPPSGHESGGRYEWELSSHPDEITLAAMPEWLIADVCSEPTAPAGGPQASPNRRPLWPSAQRLLRGGNPDPTRRSESVLSIANGAAMVGWTVADLYLALMDPTNVGGAKVRERQKRQGDEAAWQFVQNAYDKAIAGMRDSPVAAFLAELAAAIDDTRWGGQAGGTDRAVLTALADTATHARQNPFTASTRQLSELAGVTEKTARTSLRRLRDGGWLRTLDKGGVHTASTHKLLIPACEPLSIVVDEISQSGGDGPGAAVGVGRGLAPFA
jgi:Bifunctional DNA primase/polymerase, N-terminal